MRSMIRKARCILADLIAPSDHRQPTGGPLPTGQPIAHFTVRPETPMTDEQFTQFKAAMRRFEMLDGV